MLKHSKHSLVSVGR